MIQQDPDEYEPRTAREQCDREGNDDRAGGPPRLVLPDIAAVMESELPRFREAFDRLGK